MRGEISLMSYFEDNHQEMSVSKR